MKRRLYKQTSVDVFKEGSQIMMLESKNIAALACPAPMCTPTKPSLGGAGSWEGGGGDDDGVIIFAGGIEVQDRIL